METDCGVREEVFDTITRKVEVAELKEAKQMREKLKRKNATGGGSVSGNGYDAVWIPAGSFTMGCTKGVSDCDSDEKPSHKVTLTKGFYMMTTEVTQGLYKDVMGSNPSSFSSCGAKCPVEQVSWYDAVKMANKLSERDGLESCYQIGSGYDPIVSWNNKECTGWRLPTEAEWEYAARGGEDYKYAGSNNIDEVAWYSSNSGSKTHPVGQKKANGYGLYDMSGNVWEWVWDPYDPDAYRKGSQVDPISNKNSGERVERSPGWIQKSNERRYYLSHRCKHHPKERKSNRGFRLVRRIR